MGSVCCKDDTSLENSQTNLDSKLSKISFDDRIIIKLESLFLSQPIGNNKFKVDEETAMTWGYVGALDIQQLLKDKMIHLERDKNGNPLKIGEVQDKYGLYRG